jgi:hypothetical protein
MSFQIGLVLKEQMPTNIRINGRGNDQVYNDLELLLYTDTDLFGDDINHVFRVSDQKSLKPFKRKCYAF